MPYAGAVALIDALNYNVSIKKMGINKASDHRIENPITGKFEHSRVNAQIRYLTETRNKLLIPAAVRRASLYLIAIRRTPNYHGMGGFADFPKEIIKIIAMEVWASRKDPIWIKALTESERTGK